MTTAELDAHAEALNEARRDARRNYETRRSFANLLTWVKLDAEYWRFIAQYGSV